MNNFLIAVKRLSKVLFTNRCKLCGDVTELDREFCENCEVKEKIPENRCKHCGCAKDDCTCKKHKNEYKQIVAPYYYEDSVVRAVHNFKDNDMPFLAEHMANEMAKEIKKYYSEITFDCITFVPLRKFHTLKRGFNQSELLADELSKILNVKSAPLLSKVRYTGVQHHKTARQRAADTYGAYDVLDDFKDKLSEKTILLVDDVKTTGSTLNECAKMLKIYGAGAVYCTSFAITKKEKNKPDTV